MRAKTYYSERPDEIQVERTGDSAVIFFRQNIAEIPQPEEGDPQFMADEYTLTVPYTEGLLERVANSEAWLQRAIQEDYDKAAAKVRAIRDELLAESDSEMALDRQGLVVPSGSTFTAWLAFLKGLGDILSGAVSAYRQALRDVPQQEGFPYDVNWPVAPAAGE